MDEQREQVRTSYEAMAARYEAERSSDIEHEGLVALEDSLPDDPRVLDIGCGAGRGPLERFPSGNSVGLDFSAEQLRLATERTQAGLVVGDMTALPFAENSFEAVTAFYSVIHLPVADHSACYEEVARVLEPGGQFIFSIGDDWVGETDDWLDSGERMVWSFPPLTETVERLEAAGFVVEERYERRSELDDADWPFFRCRAA